MIRTTDKIIIGVLVVMLVGLGGVFITASGANEEVKSMKSSTQVLFKEIGPVEAKAIALDAVPGIIKEWEVDNEDGRDFYEISVMLGDVEKEVKIDFSGNILSIETEEEDVPITGTPLERASKAALDYIGEGRVTDTEIGDEEGFYEIEIRLDNGDEVDVHLDENFNVLSTEYD